MNKLYALPILLKERVSKISTYLPILLIICKMVISNNVTLYGINDTNVRYVWAGYHFILLVSSLVGDATILIASIKYDALKLSDFILTVIQHIAVADLILSVFYVFPAFVSLVHNKWVLGDAFCYIRDPFTYLCLPASLLLVCAMTTGKWLQLKWPLRTWNWTHKRAHMVCAAIWTFSLYSPVVAMVAARMEVSFDYSVYNCVYVRLLENEQNLKMFTTINYAIWLIVPCVVVIATSTMMLIEARKARREGENLNWKGVSTVLLTAVCVCVSTLPMILFILTKLFVKTLPLSTEVGFRRVASFLKQLNIVANIYVYTLTVPSFRQYLTCKVRIFPPPQQRLQRRLNEIK